MYSLCMTVHIVCAQHGAAYAKEIVGWREMPLRNHEDALRIQQGNLPLWLVPLLKNSRLALATYVAKSSVLSTMALLLAS